VAIAVVRGIIVSLDTRVSGWVGTHVVQDLRAQLYSALQHRSMRYFHRQRLGDLLTRLSGDIASIEDLLVSGLTSIVSYCVTIVLFLTLLLILNPGLVLVAASILPVLTVATVVEARRGRRAQQEIRRRTSELTSTAEEGLSAIALVKAFARGEHEEHRFGQASLRSAEARLRAVRLRAVFPPLSELVAAVGTAIVVWIGARQVLAGQLSLGSARPPPPGPWRPSVRLRRRRRTGAPQMRCHHAFSVAVLGPAFITASRISRYPPAGALAAC
jgi:ABC-type multidrug transport system fused ATPase/permease subunit